MATAETCPCVPASHCVGPCTLKPTGRRKQYHYRPTPEHPSSRASHPRKSWRGYLQSSTSYPWKVGKGRGFTRWQGRASTGGGQCHFRRHRNRERLCGEPYKGIEWDFLSLGELLIKVENYREMRLACWDGPPVWTLTPPLGDGHRNHVRVPNVVTSLTTETQLPAVPICYVRYIEQWHVFAIAKLKCFVLSTISRNEKNPRIINFSKLLRWHKASSRSNATWTTPTNEL